MSEEMCKNLPVHVLTNTGNKRHYHIKCKRFGHGIVHKLQQVELNNTMKKLDILEVVWGTNCNL